MDRFAIFDTPSEAGFDDVAQLACQLCAVPVSLVSLVAGDRQWFKARVDFPSCGTDLNSSVCAHALAEADHVLVIPDLTSDPRTCEKPLVTGEPFIRFYVGAPLVTSQGETLGTLCVIDKVPSPAGLTAEQATSLQSCRPDACPARDLEAISLFAGAATTGFIEAAAYATARASGIYRRGLFNHLSEGFVVGEVVRSA